MSNHIATDGDCFSSLAAQTGFPSWKALHGHPANAGLKAKRPNPNLLNNGDVVVLPEREPKTVAAATGAEHIFKAKRPHAKLRLFLRDVVGRELGLVKCILEVGGKTSEARSDGKGLVEFPDIPLGAKTATLTVELPAPPPPAPPPADGLVLPKETFTLPAEPERPSEKRTPPTQIVWTLSLGALHTLSSTLGAQQRLHNLGYLGATSGTLDTATSEAVRAFRVDRNRPAGDLDGTTRQELEKAHDTGAR